MSPLKMFEYMAAGKPILASDLPILREVLRHEHNCLLCDPSNIDTWVASLKRLLAEQALARTLAETARRDFLKNYTWSARAQTVLQPPN